MPKMEQRTWALAEEAMAEVPFSFSGILYKWRQPARILGKCLEKYNTTWLALLVYWFHNVPTLHVIACKPPLCQLVLELIATYFCVFNIACLLLLHKYCLHRIIVQSLHCRTLLLHLLKYNLLNISTVLCFMLDHYYLGHNYNLRNKRSKVVDCKLYNAHEICPRTYHIASKSHLMVLYNCYTTCDDSHYYVHAPMFSYYLLTLHY